MTTVLAFIFAIGLLVTIHELGHYWAARLCNVKVLRFSIGFGKELFIRESGPDKTEWVVAAIPLGGFVKMADERDGSAAPEDVARAFNTQSIPKRMFIIIAGPLANFILAGLLYWVVFMMGTPGAIPFVAAPIPGSVAGTAGFTEYDKIIAVGDKRVATWSEARLYLLDRAATRETVAIQVETRRGQNEVRQLPLASITAQDLDKDFLAKLGLVAYRLKIEPIIDVIEANSPAAKAGLKPGDRIVAVDGKPVAQWEDFVRIVMASPGKPLKLAIVSANDTKGEVFDATVTPETVKRDGKEIGRIGAGPRVDKAANDALFTTVRHGSLESISYASAKVWEMSVFSLKMLGRMITGDVSWKNLSGPITIADYAGQSAKLGAVYYITFLALISVSIGVLNLLPIPVLDGGQLLYHIAELIKGSPISEKSLEIGQRLGVALLLGLTALAFFNDIQRLVSG
jgi:regulator of sigma E protease